MINSFDPIIDSNCKVLILGTIPGVKSLQKKEYYGHERNAFWKIIYSLFNQELSSDYSTKKAFLIKHNIALWDVLKSCHREGSSDSNIKNSIPNDINGLLKKYPNIKAIFFNGETAQKLFNGFISKNLENTNISFKTLPSTSPANTKKIEQKLDKWKEILLIIENRS